MIKSVGMQECGGNGISKKALGISIIEASAHILSDMLTFAEAGVSGKEE